MGTKTGIEWTDSTWSPIRYRVKANAAEIAREKGYTSLVSIAEKMAGRVGQHCEHVSPGCEHCYAESNNHRCLPANGTGLPYDRRSRDLVEPFIDEFSLVAPLKWKPILTGIARGEGVLVHKAHRDGCISVTRQRPRNIFVENQSDLFHESVTDAMRDQVLVVTILAWRHRYQILTKRAEVMLDYFLRLSADPAGRLEAAAAEVGMDDEVCCHVANFVNGYARWREMPDDGNPLNGTVRRWPLPNVWLGVSAENQAMADERIPLLLQTPAAVRFISAEPLLGPISIEHWLSSLQSRFPDVKFGDNVLPGVPWKIGPYKHIDWVIVGGESGPGARPMHPDWARSLRDQCQAAKVPFFFKQWGEWVKYIDRDKEDPDWRQDYSRMGKSDSFRFLNLAGGSGFHGERLHVMQRIGKKAAGHQLDGREWKQFPSPRQAEDHSAGTPDPEVKA